MFITSTTGIWDFTQIAAVTPTVGYRVHTVVRNVYREARRPAVCVQKTTKGQ